MTNVIIGDIMMTAIIIVNLFGTLRMAGRTSLMKISKEQTAQNRQKILDAAARLFRERGLEGSGVAEIMAEAGFTHGGFYGHFNSKADLVAQACSTIFDDKIGLWNNELPDGTDGIHQLARRYLTLDHCADAGSACPMVTIAADAARNDGPIRDAYTEGVKGLIAVLAKKLGEETDPEARARAIRTWTRVAGAVSIARSVKDSALAEEILSAALEGVLSDEQS